MDEMKRVEFGDAGAMPELLRAKVRRRRLVHRVKMGSAAVCVVLVAVLGVLIARPGAEVRDDGWRDGAVISIDDPMFDALDGGRGQPGGDLTRWRAGARVDGDWVLEM